MSNESLSKNTLQIMDNYINLNFSNKKINCPYYNNQRQKVRGGLSVRIGKGTPDDIIEEATIESLKRKIDINNLDEKEIKKFLVDNNLGVDCSALVYYLLKEEVKNKKSKNLIKYISFPEIKNPIRRLIAKIRHVENTSVRVLSHPKNSQEINIKKIKPGDMIFMLKTGYNKKMNHVMLIYQIDILENNIKKIYYVHSFRWTSEGQYNHGVRKGVIEIINNKEDLLDQGWIENEKENNENETYLHAKMADKLVVKRLNIML